MTKKNLRSLAIETIPVFNENNTIGEIKSEILSNSKKYTTINYVYLTNDKSELTGTISIKDVLGGKIDILVSELMTRNPIVASENTHQEKIVRLSLDHNIKAIPVISEENKFIGVISSDTILRILDEEMHEDILKIGGHTRNINNGNDSIFSSIISRAPWLIIGTLGGILTAHIIKSFQEFSGATLAIASFIPLIVYVASAVVAQLNALVIRQISTGKKVNIFAYSLKQLFIISIIAVILSGILEITLSLLGIESHIRLSVATGLFFTCLSAIIAGVFIPHLFNKLKIDPAAATGPVSTIIQDMTSVVIFLTIAHYL